MTYKEIQDRLTKCEQTLNLLKNGSFDKNKQVDVEETTQKLQVLRESLQKQLLEAEKGTVATDDEDKAADLADKGVNVKLTSEMKPGDPEDLERRRMERLSPKDQETIQKIYALMQAEKGADESVKDDDHDTGDLDIGHQDDEPNMLKKDLYDIAVNAAKLYKQIHKYDMSDGEVDFPHWWQSKVIKAKDYIGAAQHYLEAEEKQPAIDKLALEEDISESPMTMAYTKIVKKKPAANEGRSLSDIQTDIEKVKKLAPAMNQLPQDDPKRQAFIKKVKSLNQEKKDYEAGMHSKIKKTGADQELDTTDEALPTGFGTGQGRSKTISKGRESRPDLKAKQAAAIAPKKKYVMKNGIPHKYDADGNLVPLKRMNELRGSGDDIIEVIKAMAMEMDGDEIEAAMEVMEFIGEHYKIDFEFGRAGGGNYGRRDGAPYEGVIKEGYEPKHFDICPGATTFRKKLLKDKDLDKSMLDTWTRQNDSLFKLEKDAIKAKKATDAQVKKAQKIADDIKATTKKMGKPVSGVGYVDGHVDKVKELVK